MKSGYPQWENYYTPMESSSELSTSGNRRTRFKVPRALRDAIGRDQIPGRYTCWHALLVALLKVEM